MSARSSDGESGASAALLFLRARDGPRSQLLHLLVVVRAQSQRLTELHALVTSKVKECAFTTLASAFVNDT
jgi:hypothetical protein